MAAERPAQQFGQVYREAEPRAASAKFLNPAARAPDAEWQAIATNPERPSLQAGAHVPTNAMVARLAADEIVVAMVAGKSLVNAIGPLLERAGETT